MRRRLLFILGGLLAGTLLVLVAVPWWLGIVVTRSAGIAGVTVERYERIGYARFALEGVRFVHPSVRVEVVRVEAPTPFLWGWRHWRGSQGEIVAGEWSVDVVGSESEPADDPSGWVPLRTQLARIMDTLEKWLPAARTGPGVVRWPEGGLQTGPVEWRERRLDVSDLALFGAHADAVLNWPANDAGVSLIVTSTDGQWRGEVFSNGAVVEGDLTWWDQPARLEARFDPEGWLPAEAGLTATDWRIDGERLRLGEQYHIIAGDAEVSWRDGRLEITALANGEPVPGLEVPPLTVGVRGSGTAEAFTIAEFDVQMPGVQASLDAPVEVNPSEGLQPVRSQFIISANLAELPWGGLRGQVEGVADVLPAEGTWPVVEASLNLEEAGRDDWELTSAAVRVRFEWPWIHLTDANLTTSEDGHLELMGAWNFPERQLLDATLSGRLMRADVARWLPDGIQFEAVGLTAQASGVWPELLHEGGLEVDELQVAEVKPLVVAGTWHGWGQMIDTLELTARSGEASLTALGAFAPGEVRLTQLTLQGGTDRLMELEAPALIRWTPSPLVEGLMLAGDDARLELSLQAGREGRIALQAQGMVSAWVQDWYLLPGPGWQVDSLDLDGTWNDGAMVFALDTDVMLELGEERAARITLAAKGDGEGIRIDALRAVEGEIAIIGATGRVPVTVWPGTTPLLRIDDGGAVALTLSSEPNPSFWHQFAELTGIRLEDPQVSATIEGTWSQPRGSLNLGARHLSPVDGRWVRTFPEVSGLDLRLIGDGEGISLEEFQVSVAGQAVRASGRLPFVLSQWAEVRDDPLAFLEQVADLRIEIPDADLAVLSRHMPDYLAPTGRLQVDVAVRPGGSLEGFIRLQDATSRPLGPLGILQEIGADIRLNDRQVEFQAVTARAGGRLVTLSGTVALPREGGPQIDLALRGNNLPFVRQSGLLIRGDLDLKLVTLDGGETQISGITRLRDSLFLSDLRALIPSGGRAAAPARRPPYFAVGVAPFNRWLLDVDVQGERFLRLRTAVFNGTVSARFRLGGTLGDPRAIGEATINEGQVLLPFATFRVQQGWVRLTEADPYEPQLFLNGTARRYGHDVRLELSGTASNPALVFTSSPPLESEQILLMVMAGEPPGDEATHSGGQRAVRLGAYLGRSLITSFGGDPERAERLNLTLGEKVSRQGRETYGIEYQLDPRWSLVGEYDEFDEFNAGVKWRLRAREASDGN